MLDYNELEVGKFYKNIKIICETLGRKYKDGTDSRKALLKEIECHYKLEKQGRGYLVKEKYKIPKPKIDNRGKSEGSRNNYKGIYAEYIDQLLFGYLIKHPKKDERVIYTTNNKIAEGCGIVNINYRTALNNQWKLYNVIKKELHIESNAYCLIDAFTIVKTKIREIVRSSLDRLKKANKLDYEYSHFVYIPYTSRIPNEIELQCIITAEEETMKEMRAESKAQIDNNEKKRKEFNGKVLKKVQQQFAYIQNIYMGYTIILCENIIAPDDSEMKGLTEKLNQIVLESVKQQPQKIQDKTKKHVGGYWGLRNPFWRKWDFDRMSKNYIMQSSSILDILCNLNAENIVQKILDCKETKSPDFRSRKEDEDRKAEDKIIEEWLEED